MIPAASWGIPPSLMPAKAISVIIFRTIHQHNVPQCLPVVLRRPPPVDASGGRGRTTQQTHTMHTTTRWTEDLMSTQASSCKLETQLASTTIRRRPQSIGWTMFNWQSPSTICSTAKMGLPTTCSPSCGASTALVTLWRTTRVTSGRATQSSNQYSATGILARRSARPTRLESATSLTPLSTSAGWRRTPRQQKRAAEKKK